MTDPTAHPTQGQQHQPAGSPPMSPAEDANMASLVHFLNIILVIPAVIIYIMFKDRGQRVAVESKEALNWTINVAAVVIVLNVLNVILAMIPVIGAVAWILITLLIWAVLIANLAFAIMGGLKVKNGGSYRYPMNYRWIK
ncbi:DUF4870 domain-containing protein [Agrococcus casei]|uniref:DUF4870 domain-containing protein n=1 Tax=Agrococcus casei TaxID=343512 RepID=UPI003F8FB9AC